MDASSLYVFDGDRTYLIKYPIDDFQLTIDPSSLNSRNIKWIITYYPNIGIYEEIEEEANKEVEILNNKLNGIPKVLPSLGINLIYRF